MHCRQGHKLVKPSWTAVCCQIKYAYILWPNNPAPGKILPKQLCTSPDCETVDDSADYGGRESGHPQSASLGSWCVKYGRCTPRCPLQQWEAMNWKQHQQHRWILKRLHWVKNEETEQGLQHNPMMLFVWLENKLAHKKMYVLKGNINPRTCTKHTTESESEERKRSGG